MFCIAAIALLSLAATAQGQVTAATNYNPVTITASSAPYDIIATPITPNAPYSQAAFQCNVTGDSRFPPYASGTFPLTVSVPVGQRVRVIFANGNLNGATVTQQGEPGVIVQQGGGIVVQQLGGASPIVQRPGSPVVQSVAPPSVVVQQTGPTVVQQDPGYQTASPVPTGPPVTYVPVPVPVTPVTPVTPVAPTPVPTGTVVPAPPPNSGPLVCPPGQAGTCDYSAVSNTCRVSVSYGSYTCDVYSNNVGGGNQCCCCPIPPSPTPTPTTTTTATPTPTPTTTTTATPTPTPTMSTTATPTPTPTMSTTATPTPTPTMSDTATPTPTPTDTKKPTDSPTPTPTMTMAPTPTMTTPTPTMTTPAPTMTTPAPTMTTPAPTCPSPAPCCNKGRRLLGDNDNPQCPCNMDPCCGKSGRKLQGNCDQPSGRRLLQDSGLVPGGPNNGLVEYVALASANTVSGFYAGSTQFGVPYVEFTASEAARGQTATFRGVLEVAQVVGGMPLYPFRPNPSLSPECQVNVNFKVA